MSMVVMREDEAPRTVHANLALILQVALVRNDDDGEPILVLHAEDLLVEGADLLEGAPGRDGVDEQEALARTHVLFPHGPGRIQFRSATAVRT